MTSYRPLFCLLFCLAMHRFAAGSPYDHGGSSSSHSSSSVSSSSSSSGGVSESRSTIAQSPGGTIRMNAGTNAGSLVTWYLMVNGARRELGNSKDNGAGNTNSRTKIEYTGTDSSLTISESKESDSGTYLCIFTSKGHQSEHYFELTVGDGNGSGMTTASTATAGLLLALQLLI